MHAVGTLLSISLTMLLLAGCAGRNTLGNFEGSSDIGEVDRAGAVEYSGPSGSYRVTGGGENIWGERDAFHYTWRRLPGDLVFSAGVDWESAGGDPHRKAGLMVRASLEADAPYADVMVHGDGLIALQYRSEKGGETREVQSTVRDAESFRMERDGDLFTVSVSRDGTVFQSVGAVLVELPDTVYAGLAVSAHQVGALETAIFTGVSLDTLGSVPDEDRIVESTLEIYNVETGERRVVYRARDHFEAPNWSQDGSYLLYNSHGSLYEIPVSGGSPKKLDTGTANRCNNDHGFSPDGSQIALSHSPEGQPSLVYVVSAEGGEPRLVTPTGPSYWHGWSPDGTTLAFVGQRNDEYDIYTVPVEGGPEHRLTTAVGLDDGPDYSPDGRYIYFNSVRTGQMKIWRMDSDGSNQVQLTPDDEFGDWFPHPSPDGAWIVYISYDRSVEGHPANKQVVLRLMPTQGGEPRTIVTLFGGQGTMNVPNWSPDSREFAFVSYRLVRSDTPI